MEDRFKQSGEATGLPNRNAEPAPYYLAYDDRYRRVYAQGVEFWTADPDEIRETTASVDVFLEGIGKSNAVVLECGCGEGHLAVHLIQRGMHYVGVDISPAAIRQARSRTVRAGVGAESLFHVADSTKLQMIQAGSIDIAVDNYHFHMLVTDGDRQRYLRELYRVLRNGGWAYLRENLQMAGAAVQSASSYEEFVKMTSADFSMEEDRDAWQDGKAVKIRLPRVPARFNSREGYVSELEQAGFRVDLSQAVGSVCVMHAQKPGSVSNTK